MDTRNPSSPFHGIEWNIATAAPLRADKRPPLDAHAGLSDPSPAARIPQGDGGLDEPHAGALHLRALAFRETAGALPLNADESLEERVLAVHVEHAKALALMVSIALKEIPGAKVEGSLSNLSNQGREWKTDGLSITLPDEPSRTWDLRLEGAMSRRGGSYQGPQDSREGSNYYLVAERREGLDGGLDLTKGTWDETTRPTQLAMEATAWVTRLNQTAKEYEEEAL